MHTRQVLGTSRGDYTAAAAGLGAAFTQDMDDFCESHPDVVILATSITSTEAVLRGMPLQRLRRSTLFVDVLSVKEFPRRLLLSLLPPQVTSQVSRRCIWLLLARLEDASRPALLNMSTLCWRRLECPTDVAADVQGESCGLRDYTCDCSPISVIGTRASMPTVGPATLRRFYARDQSPAVLEVRS